MGWFKKLPKWVRTALENGALKVLEALGKKITSLEDPEVK